MKPSVSAGVHCIKSRRIGGDSSYLTDIEAILAVPNVTLSLFPKPLFYNRHLRMMRLPDINIWQT
jgi:hypothetical protein